MKEDFNAHVGKIFERIAKEYIIAKIKSGGIKIKADAIGNWQHNEEEIDLIVHSSKENRSILFEVKWKELSYEDAKSILLKLIEKGKLIRIENKEYGLIAKKVQEKERLCEERFIVTDLEDIVSKNNAETMP